MITYFKLSPKAFIQLFILSESNNNNNKQHSSINFFDYIRYYIFFSTGDIENR